MSHRLGQQAVEMRLGNHSKAGPAIRDRTRDARLVGLIKDYARGPHQRAPFMTGFSASFRIILLVRFFSAMYSTIADCDETFNYWEPLHLLSHPTSPLPLQTWEYSPQYAIRSWAYVSQYVPVAGWLIHALGREKRAAFFATRIVLAFTSSACEAALTTSVAEVVSPRVAKYMLVLLLSSAGMYESATALLPSTFTMYTTTLALAYTFFPTRSGNEQYPSNDSLAYTPYHRTLKATLVFALGALLGWPFALVLSLPFVAEELFLPSGLIIPRHRYASFVATRLTIWIKTALIGTLITIPLVIIDSLAYGRLTLVPLNIIVYNILSSRRGAGPELYGTEPWHFYLFNLGLNFGPTVVIALLSIPSLILTSIFDPKRLQPIDIQAKATKEHLEESSFRSSETVLLLFRLAPLYLWLGLLTLQPHKEERFMFPAYPLLCFNAAVTICLARGWLEKAFVSATKSPYRASKTYLFSAFTTVVLLLTSLFCVSRIVHVAHSYHAPISLLNHLDHHELPRVVANLYPAQQSALVQDRLAKGLPPVFTAEEKYESGSVRKYEPSGDEQAEPKVDLSLLPVGQIKLCYGKEWYRLPSSYLVPDGVSVSFIKSDFDGILPKQFQRSGEGKELPLLDDTVGWLWPYKDVTRTIRTSFNDLNREEADQYVDISSCDYLVDADYPSSHAKAASPHEPRYTRDADNWIRVHCLPFLDGSGSRASLTSSRIDKIRATIERILWLPAFARGGTNSYADYCLLRTTRETSVVNEQVSRRSPSTQ